MARTLRPRLRRPQGAQTLRVHLASIALADAFSGVAASDDSPKWVQVTREGNFPGYMGGLKPFSFSRADLQAMVQNVKFHPSYALDTNGVPVGHVIPWDFNHASEQDPTTGQLPVAGSPAQGWTLDLEVRNDAVDGHAELWALTQFLEPARSYVRLGQYKWASVAVALNAVDAETGQNVGAMVTSIALTNTPFVEGMESLVASKNPKAPVTKPGQTSDVQAYRRSFYEAARSIDEAISNMKEMFGLPETAGISEVMQQLMIVASWFTTGAPLGTDPEYIVGALRTILNLPTLTPDSSVLEEAAKSVQMLIQQETTEAGTQTPAPVTPETSGTVPPTPQLTNKGNTTMSDNLLKALSTVLGVRDSEDAITAATKDLVQLRAGLQELFGLERDTTPILLNAAKETAGAKDKLLGLFTALGIENPDQAVAKVASTMEAAAKLKEVMPELEGLRAEKAAAEEVQVETDVESAIAASKLPASIKPALLLYRRTDPVGFKTQYKAPAPAPASHLAPTQIAQLTSRVKISNGEATIVPPDGVVNLAQFPGSNPTARAKSYLAGTVPGWDKLTNDDQFLRAVSLRKQPHVIDQQA